MSPFFFFLRLPGCPYNSSDKHPDRRGSLAPADVVFRTPAAVAVKHVQIRYFRGRIHALSLRRSASTHSAKNGEHPSGGSHFCVGVANPAPADEVCRTRATVAGGHVERRRYRARIGAPWLHRSAATDSSKNGEDPSGASHFRIGVPNSAPADAVYRTRATVAGEHVERRRYRARIGSVRLRRSASTRSAKDDEHPSDGSHYCVRVENPAPADALCRTRATVAGEHVERRRYRAGIGPVWLRRRASTYSATNGEHPSGGSHLAVGVPNSAPADAVAELVRLATAKASRDAAFVRGSHCDLGHPRSTSKKECRKKIFFCVCRGAPIIVAISTQTAVGRSPRLTWFFVFLRRSSSSTSKHATFVGAFALFRFAGVPALTLPKTANILVAVPTFASASQTPPRQTRFAVLVRRWPAGTSKDTDIVSELALLGFTGVPPLIPAKAAKIRAALPTFSSASQTSPRQTRFAVLVRRSPASTSKYADVVSRIGPVSLRRSASTRSAKDDEHPSDGSHHCVRVANPAPADAVCRTRAAVAGGHVERRRYRARIGVPWLHRSASTHSAKNGEHPSSGTHLAVGIPRRLRRLPSSCD
ncbi:hypothetical protein MRX96_058741 [Rhipicephalus microplus]